MTPEALIAALDSLLRSWLTAKLALEQSVSFDSGWFHLGVGPLMLVAASLLMRRGISSWGPWLAVLVLGALNEVIDLSLVPGSPGSARYYESVADLLLTLLIPTIALAVARIAVRRGPGNGRV